MQQANALNVERLAEADRRDRRGELYTVAEQVLDGVLTLVDREIKDNAPSIQIPPGISRAPHGPSFKRWELNDAAIWVDFPKATEAGRDQDLPFEVIACTTINVRGPSNHRNYLGRSHSLWYCDAQKQGAFRWYETAFMEPFRAGGLVAPFAMPPDSRDVSLALSPTMHTHQAAWPFMAIDQGDEEAFIERWMKWFAQAAQGQLRYPRQLPELNPTGSWRRGSQRSPEHGLG